MNPGDVRLVWFPFSYQEATPFKKRPVLVLNSVGTPPDQAVLVAMITGNAVRVRNPGPGDVVIPNWNAAGLHTPSVVRTRRLWTAEDRDFTGRVLGAIDPQVLANVVNLVRQLVT